MTQAQIANCVVLGCFFERDGVESFDFGVLQVELHDSGMTRRKDHLRNTVSCLKVIGSRVVELVEEGFKGVFVRRGADLLGQF